jgi:hypothetical protein
MNGSLVYSNTAICLPNLNPKNIIENVYNTQIKLNKYNEDMDFYLKIEKRYSRSTNLGPYQNFSQLFVAL